ncbi:MAG TPA: LysR family transcriptional regulator [Firmicutes bacterium]|nr:LysR family transcriptional regulator [Bacillota bacterium]
MEGNIQKYYAFLRTIQTGSFTRAAQELHYSQSGISRMIADLEKECGLTLMDRSRGGVSLTGAGEKLLPYFQALCAAHQNLEDEIHALVGLDSGLIRIGTFSSAATHWLPNIIREFQKQFPNIDYELLIGEYGEIEQWVWESRVDCGFLPLPLRHPLDAIMLEEDPLLVILPHDHPFAHCDVFPLAALEESPFLLLEKNEKMSISRFLEDHHLHPDIKFTTYDDYAIMAMVEQGLGISILPRLILHRTPYRIVSKPLEVPLSRTIALALRHLSNPPLALSRFLEYLPFRHSVLQTPKNL